MKYSILITILISSTLGAFSQQRKFNLGLVYKVGLSQSTISTTSDNIYNSIALVSSGTGIYKIIRLRKDSLNKIFNDLKINLYSFSYRGGYFDIESSVAKIESFYVDLDIVVPIRIELGKTVDLYFGAGPAISVLINRKVHWQGIEEKVKKETFQPGMVAEFGFITRGTSSAGLRIHYCHSEYPITDASVFFGMGVQDIFDSVRRRRQTN